MIYKIILVDEHLFTRASLTYHDGRTDGTLCPLKRIEKRNKKKIELHSRVVMFLCLKSKCTALMHAQYVRAYCMPSPIKKITCFFSIKAHQITSVVPRPHPRDWGLGTGTRLPLLKPVTTLSSFLCLNHLHGLFQGNHHIARKNGCLALSGNLICPLHASYELISKKYTFLG